MKRFFIFIFSITEGFCFTFSQSVDQAYLIDEKSNELINKTNFISEFETISNIKISKHTPQMLYNLEILCRIWGFFKYYHPAVTAGKYNWDAELFRMIPLMLDAQDDIARNEILLQWVDKMGTTVVAKKIKRQKNTNIYPDLEWIEEIEVLGEQLSHRLKIIKNGLRNESFSYYFSLKYGFQNEMHYPAMQFDDDGLRLLALFRYWNMIQYYFPYRHIMDKNWNEIIGEFIPVFLDVSNEHDYKLALMLLIAQTCDSHATSVYPEFIHKKNVFPYNFSFIEGQMIVTKCLNERLSISSDLKIGDIVIGIEHLSIEKIIEEKTPYISASNHATLLRDLGLNFTETKLVNFHIIRENDTISTDITSFPSVFQQQKKACRLLSSDIGYIYPENFDIETMTEIKILFANTKGIIIDLRCYPSSYAWDLEQYLLPEPKSYIKFSLPDIEYPGMFRFTEPKKNPVRKNRDFYKGKIIIVVNEYTQSMAETMVMAFQVAPYVKVIGSQTSGTNGDVLSINLPGNINTQISGIGVYYPDNRATQRVGISIDEEIKPTIRGIIEGRDELLERAIYLIENE